MIYRFLLMTLLAFFVSRVFAVPANRLNTESEFKRFFEQKRKDLLKFDPAVIKPTNQYFLYLGLDNDNYYRLDRREALRKGGDDFGQTHSFTLGGILREPRKGREYGVNFETSLYTHYLGCNSGPPDNPIVDQYFREITTLDFTLLDPRSKQSYFRYLLGVGLINDSHAIPPLALWQQSGNNGNGGVHKMVGLKTSLRNVPSGGRQGFVSGGWSAGKYISLERYLDLPKHLSWMNFTLESGFLARTVEEANTFYGLVKWSIPLVRSEYVVKGKGFIDFNIQGKSNYYTYENAVGFTMVLGLQFNFSKGGFIVSTTHSYGNLNPSFYKYTDTDSLINFMGFIFF